MAGRTGDVARSSLDGLWLVLVEGQEEQKLGPTFEGRVPMMARAGDDQTYLLGALETLVTNTVEALPPGPATARLASLAGFYGLMHKAMEGVLQTANGKPARTP